MNEALTTALHDVFQQIPRRHSPDNVKAMYDLLSQYESVLLSIEAMSPEYEKQVAVFFEDLDTVRTATKKSSDNKASKKTKDEFFDEASTALKDSIESAVRVLGNQDRA